MTAANVHDAHELFPLLDCVPAVRMPSGQWWLRPTKLHGDKASAPRKNRHGLRLRGIASRIAHPVVESNERLDCAVISRIHGLIHVDRFRSMAAWTQA
ncbi:hypothetical protein [Corallococcus exiguus]|uniref:Transposase n=1 Tax=Corallococcus exiguus TaxID=83462 RepID=A0A7X4YFE3_9BACT|nr:hypothetical protein [Corallococcus exiguus]NBC43332.1 hypothetical protein [Corallococcus exiguus]TNV67051.1 hypothetical protein FH620_03265 [Corallococcus exiguus]